MVNISFPGLGIPEFHLDPVAFSIGNISVRWYGIIITLGIILAFLYCAYRTKQENIIFDDLIDIAIFTIIFAVIGARTYYVLTSLDKYDSFYEMIAIWEGGIAIYGAIIAGAITVFCVCKYKKINCLKMMDAAAPSVMIGQILGRWGNFFNGEAHGGIVPEDSIFYFIRMGLYPNDVEGVRGMAYVHPTFLYESVWNLVGFIIINALYKKKKFDGQVLLMYITWYGFGRMLIEGLRTDSLYVGVFRISQVVGFACFVVGAVLLTVNLIKARRLKLDENEYIPTYAKISQNKMETVAEQPCVKISTDDEIDEADGFGTEESESTQNTSQLSDDEISNKINNIFDNK